MNTPEPVERIGVDTNIDFSRWTTDTLHKCSLVLGGVARKQMDDNGESIRQVLDSVHSEIARRAMPPNDTLREIVRRNTAGLRASDR